MAIRCKRVMKCEYWLCLWSRREGTEQNLFNADDVKCCPISTLLLHLQLSLSQLVSQLINPVRNF